MSDKNNTDLLTIRYVARLLSSLQSGVDAPTLPSGIGWRDVYRVCHQHSVAGAAYEAAQSLISATEDAELIERFERARRLDIAKHTVQSFEYEKILAAFSERGVAHLSMKGFIFKSLWTRPEYRSMADLDFFVGDNTEAAGEVLSSLGYTPEKTDGEIHDAYEKPPFMKVELHKQLYRDCPDGFDSWHRSASSPYRFEMKSVDFFAFAVKHTYKHYEEGGFGIRTLFDLYLYREKYAEELDADDALSTRLREMGLSDFYDKLLRLMSLWFLPYGTESADTELLEFEAYVLFGGSFGNEDNRALHGVRKRGRVGYVLSRLFPPYRDMKKRYKWLSSLPILLPVAYLVRLVAAIFSGRFGTEARATANTRRKK